MHSKIYYDYENKIMIMIIGDVIAVRGNSDGPKQDTNIGFPTLFDQVVY